MAEKMRAIFKEKPAPGLVMKQADVPTPGPRDVLVKILAASICGTDVHIYDWDEWSQKRVPPPIIIGHEFCGKVIEKGRDVTSLEIGDLISGETHLYCGLCYQCRTGDAHICKNVKLRGVDTTGCFSDYHVVPENTAWKNDPKISPEVLSAQEPLGNAVFTVFSGEVAGKTILIMGCGPIGVCAAALCHQAGAEKVISVDLKEFRLKMAKEMGADVVLNAGEEDVVKRVMNETDGEGVDVFLEMAGSPKAFKQGMDSLKPGGRVSLLGIYKKPFEVDVTNDIVFKAPVIHGINGRKLWDTWYKARAFMRSGRIDLNKIITHRIKFDDFEKGFQIMKSGECGKVVMKL
ncbi:MAG: L-threonine 3-dehydrogenase [Candidatus Micrarchaeota archaeon]|nr:L-threonine 3-dehydrogenase [Candidatus Micrarchaeota archaeon]